jgi:hypothetical protein
MKLIDCKCCNDIGIGIWKEFYYQVDNKVKNKVKNKVWEWVSSQVRGQVDKQFNTVIWEQVCDEVWSRGYHVVQFEVCRLVRAQINNEVD